MSLESGFDIDEIRRHARTLLLCSDSPMTDAIDTLIDCHRMSQPLEVAQVDNAGGKVYLELAYRLGVEVTVSEVHLHDNFSRKDWLYSTHTPNVRCIIPPLRIRWQDFWLILPFRMSRVIETLKAINPDFQMPKVHSSYLAMLCQVLSKQDLLSFSNRLKKDLIRAESTGQLYLREGIGNTKEDFEELGTYLLEFSEPSLFLLGFCRGCDVFGDFSKYGLSTACLMDRRTVQQLNRPNEFMKQVSDAEIVFLVRDHEWNVGQLGSLLRNVAILNKHFDKFEAVDQSLIVGYLKLVLMGGKDKDALDFLGLKNQRELLAWKLKNALLVEEQPPERISDLWAKACTFFGIEYESDPLAGTTSKDFLQSREVLAISNEKKVPSFASPLSLTDTRRHRFVATKDFRNVRAKSGVEYALTERQAQVVQYLHDAQSEGLKGVTSQAAVIEEVYSGAKSNNLRKLFNCNEAYDDLIEPGERKGTVRLKT